MKNIFLSKTPLFPIPLLIVGILRAINLYNMNELNIESCLQLVAQLIIIQLLLYVIYILYRVIWNLIGKKFK